VRNQRGPWMKLGSIAETNLPDEIHEH